MRPAVYRRAELPESVEIYEVGPRDGLQNEATLVPLEAKVAFITALVSAGLRVVEATSFVSPTKVPQMSDADQLLGQLRALDGVRYPVLVANLQGLERARRAGGSDIAVFASVTETFSQRNLGCGVEESLARFAPVVSAVTGAGGRVRGYLSMCFGDPWEVAVAPAAVVAVARRLLDMGCRDLSIGDTIGVATPGHVRTVIDALGQAGIGVERLGVHFHDTYGQALANVLAALQSGVTTVDSSAGGLGGCPFAKSATGNLATEDLVWMLDGLGIATGVRLDPLVDASAAMAAILRRPSPSAVLRARLGGAAPGAGQLR